MPRFADFCQFFPPMLPRRCFLDPCRFFADADVFFYGLDNILKGSQSAGSNHRLSLGLAPGHSKKKTVHQLFEDMELENPGSQQVNGDPDEA